MIRTLVGNIFESQAQTLVNTVNCVGIMGKGLALEFKKLFPDMYEDYVVRCNAKQVRLGEPYLYRRLLPGFSTSRQRITGGPYPVCPILWLVWNTLRDTIVNGGLLHWQFRLLDVVMGNSNGVSWVLHCIAT